MPQGSSQWNTYHGQSTYHCKFWQIDPLFWPWGKNYVVCHMHVTVQCGVLQQGIWYWKQCMPTWWYFVPLSRVCASTIFLWFPRVLSLSVLPSLFSSSVPPSLHFRILPPLIFPLFTPLLSSPEIGATAGVCWKLSNGIHLVCSKWSCKPLYLTFKNLHQLLYSASCNNSVHCSDFMTPSSGRFTLDWRMVQCKPLHLT